MLDLLNTWSTFSVDTKATIIVLVLSAAFFPFIKTLISYCWNIFITARKKTYLINNLKNSSYGIEEIEQAVKYYIEPSFLHIDPAYEKQPDYSMKLTEKKSLVKKVDDFCANSSNSQNRKFFLILGDGGSGKTAFVLNYIYNYLKRKKNKLYPIEILSFINPSIDNLIHQIPNKKNTILVLTKLHEDMKAIDDLNARINQIINITGLFKKVIRKKGVRAL